MSFCIKRKKTKKKKILPKYNIVKPFIFAVLRIPWLVVVGKN